jgi:predicted SAM-dependent methyltransferase
MPAAMTVLHVGCGPKNPAKLPAPFRSEAWKEIRFDIDPKVKPDVTGTMTDMSGFAGDSVDAVYSSHNLEHLYVQEIPLALKEFLRVLKRSGFVLITCPDLQSIAALVADDKLIEPAYTSAAGPISPFDMIYGHRASLMRGNLHMAHRSGFTARLLAVTLREIGFGHVVVARDRGNFALWALATKALWPEAETKAIVQLFMPPGTADHVGNAANAAGSEKTQGNQAAGAFKSR